MKKNILFIASLFAIILTSCNGLEDKKTFEAALTFDKAIPATVTYGQPVQVAGSIVSENVITGCVLRGVVKTLVDGKDAYTEVGDPQTFEVKDNKFDDSFFPDDKTITDIAVILSSDDLTSTTYYPVSVTGEWNAHVWTNKSAALYADAKVATHDNDPEAYPEEGTGAGSDTKSFFSMPGVTIDNEVKHILSLNEMRSVDGLNGSAVFINVLQNTSNNAYIGGQRGFAFAICKASSMAGGTMGRQCDVYEVNGHGIKDANVDINFTMLAVNGSWAGEKYNEVLFKYIDSLFIAINPEVVTIADQMRAHYQLSEIQKKLDNATLGVETDPTSLTMKTYLRRYTNAGSSSTSALSEGYRAGDYILVRTKRGTEENPTYLYGIMQVVQTYDESSTFVDGRIDKDKAAELFGKPIYLNIKIQSEL